MLRKSWLVFVVAGLAVAETQNGTVRSGGQPIPGATVTADCGGEKISTITDDAGNFEMGGLPAAACRFSVAMFGFEPLQREAAVSASSLILDLKLQTRATLPPVETPVTAAKTSAPAAQPGTPADAGQTASTTNGNGPGRGGFGRGGGRGGFGRGGFPQGGGQGGFGRGGQPQAGAGRGGAQNAGSNGQGGAFQNLNLVQNGDNPVEAEIVPDPNAADATAGGANEAFLVNGSLSQGVQAQAGDGQGMGGAFGFGPGGPGGFGGPAGNPFGAAGGPALTDNTGLAAAVPGAAGPGGGGPGGGGGGFGGGRGGGGFGGGRGGGRGPGRGAAPNRNAQFGNRINRGRGRQFQGSIYYTVGNSVLNARPYSFTSPTQINGQEVPKAGYAANRFGFSGGGPLNIPHLFSSDKTFWFVNYTGNRSKNGFDRVTTVPTAAERMGDFSGIGTIVNYPFTNTPLPGNSIPASMLNIDSAAAKLLGYIPLPNAPGLRNNYQLIGANPTNNDNLQTRINQTLTSKDRLDININYQRRDSENIQTFGFVDPTHGYGLSTSLTYGRTFSRSLINSLVWSFSRNRNQTLSSFSNGTNIEAALGITGVSLDPAAYGPPTLGFTNFGSLTDATPSLTRAQTSALNDNLIQIHGKQTITYGFGFQRRQNNTMTDANGRGNFSFTGIATGYDLADFLLALPQSTSVVRYTDNSRYLRETTLSAYATDDYRVRSNLTINAGLRWEYFGPYTEKNGNLADLDINPGFSAVAVVLPGQTGPFSGTFGRGIVNPDYKLFSPRIGVAWKPWKAKQVVVRSGYGIYYNGGVYGSIGSQLANQPPFAQTSTQQTNATAPLTLENGFPVVASQTIANTFSVNKNYTPGYAQTWTASIQESFGRSYVVEVLYNGTKGTHLDVLQLPNRALPGDPLTAQQRLPIPYASEFTYDNSIGNSSYNAGQVRFTRRFARGTSFTLLYTYSKAIDDSSTLGGGPVLIPGNVGAERALSPFDQRHNLRVNYNYQSPIGNTRTGTTATLLRGWTVAGTLTATSGPPFTAIVTGDPSGTAYTGNARAEATGLPVTTGSGFFNPAAFAVPATGTFGNAGRDTIPGIPNFSLTASFFRSFRIDDKRRIEFRLDTVNPINHVNVTGINTTVNSIQYGLPTNAGAMRSMTATVRLRF